MKASDQAIAAGIGSVPNPITDTDAPWFVYEPLITSMIVADATGISGAAGTVIDVDSKAMRKIGPNEDLAVVVDNNSAVDGGFFWHGGRMLVKLH